MSAHSLLYSNGGTVTGTLLFESSMEMYMLFIHLQTHSQTHPTNMVQYWDHVVTLQTISLCRSLLASTVTQFSDRASVVKLVKI